MNEYYTYLYSDPIRNEPIYVGKGKGARVKIHLRRNDMHPFTHRLAAMKRLGVEPIIKFLVEGVDEEFAHLVEEEAITKWGRKDLGLGPLLNLTDGGEGSSGWKMSEETKRKIGDRARGRTLSVEHRANIGKGGTGRVGPNNGKTFSEETTHKMSAAKIGMKWPALTCPCCGKEGSSNAMKRWHFGNCKVA